MVVFFIYSWVLIRVFNYIMIIFLEIKINVCVDPDFILLLFI